VGSLVEDHEGVIWVGAYTPGRLCTIRGAKVQCNGDGSFGYGVWGLYEDSKRNLWVSSATGLWRWDAVHPDRYTLPGDVNTVIEGESGELLLDVSTGVRQLVGGRIQNYAAPGVSGQLKAMNLFRSSDGSLWIAASQGLLHVHQGRTDTFGTGD